MSHFVGNSFLFKVFENLLASYNEETQTTARKQTGPFYTPRHIVEYMVDESLKAHLSSALTRAGMREKNAAAALNILFAYTEKEIERLIEIQQTKEAEGQEIDELAQQAMDMLEKLFQAGRIDQDEYDRRMREIFNN